jgi:hypothetical protein
MIIQHPTSLLPIIQSIWRLTSVYAIFLLMLTLYSVYRLALYVTDRRKHFYPLLATSLVIAVTLSFFEIILYAFGFMPDQLLLGPASTPWNFLIALCLLALVIVAIIPKKLPLTRSQKRKRMVS